jgi:sugar/nucleoside kinase (ribokinase family)
VAEAFVYGEIGPDNLIRVPWLPDAERAAPVLSDTYHPGGAASNVAVLLAHWGIRVRLSGNALGDDFVGEIMLGFLKQYPEIDLSYLMVASGTMTPFCRIMIPPNGDRVVLFYHAHEAPTVRLALEMLQGCQLCILDDNGGAERMQAAGTARQLSIPVVCGDVYRLDHPLLPYADVIVNSAHLIRSKLPGVDVEAHACDLHAVAGAAIITSYGAEPVHIIDREGQSFRVAPPAGVVVVDATGAGDALKAGVCFGFLTGRSLPEAVRIGVSAGALVVQQIGACTNPPAIEEVMRLSEGLEILEYG